MMFRRYFLLAVSAAWATKAWITKAWAEDAEITIDNFTFSPASLTVAMGARVTWTNRDDIPHTVTDAANTPPAWRSHALDTDESFTRTFDTPGTYPYFCSLHPHMMGSVTVR